MPRILGLSIWLSVVFSVVGSTHYYIWARLVRDVALPAPWNQVGLAIVLVLGISLPVAMVLSRLARGALVTVMATVAYVWMGCFFLLLCLLGATDAVRALATFAQRLGGEAAPVDMARSLWLARALGAGVAGVATATAIYAARTALRGPQVERVRVTLAKLPKSMSGLTIAQVSDLHVSTLIGRAYVERVVEQVNALKPSIVALTGDLVDGSVEQLRDSIAPLAKLKATHGVYFITGNHEYYSGVDSWIAELTRLGVRVLRNERVTIGTGTESLDLAGIDDWTARSFGNGHGPDLKAALAGRDTQREVVLLAHQPKAVFEAAEQGVGLMLSGHTHGGQIWPFNYLVKLQQPYVSGLNRHGATQVYVNRGTGFWGPPMRLGAAPELTLLELQPAGA